jgi:hypothetical protein
MKTQLSTLALACFAATGASAADLSPGNGQSIHVSGIDGVVYYTVEQDGYRVVATLASGEEQQPVRFTSTLTPGQRVVISVPQAVGQASVDFEILRNGDTVVVGEPVTSKAANSAKPMAMHAALME